MTAEGTLAGDDVPEAPAAEVGTRSSRVLRRSIDALCAVVLPAAVVAGIYLFPYLRDPDTMPFGSDTAGYIGRVTIVHDLGTPALDGLEHSLSSRPAYPVVLAVLTDLTGASPLELAWIMPAVLGAAIALTAGAVAVAGLEEPPRRALAYGIGVGGSGFVAWTAMTYATNLLLDPIALALVLVAVLVGVHGRSRLAGILLGVGATLVHWMFAALLGGLVLVIGLALLTARALREGAALRPPPDAGMRVLTMLGATVAASVAALGLAPGVTDRLVPHVDPDAGRPNERVDERLPAMRVPFTLAASALATIFGLGTGSLVRRWSIIVLAIWALLSPLGLVGWYWFDLRLPPYRSSGFALALPILTVLAAALLGDALARRARFVGGAIRVVLLGAAVALLITGGIGTWNRQEAVLTSAELAQFATVSAYLRDLPEETSVVLVTPLGRVRPTRVWAGLPAERIPHVSLLPTRIDMSAPALGIAMPPDAVVLGLLALDDRSPRYPGYRLDPDVVLLQGPIPATPVTAGVPPRAPSAGRASWLVLASLLVLGAAGSGWAGLAGRDLIVRATLAPAFGIAIVGGLGALTSRLGIPFGSGPSLGLVAGSAALGWTADAGWHRWAARRDRRA